MSEQLREKIAAEITRYRVCGMAALDAADAILSLLREEGVDLEGWRPIESAPKDATRIWLGPTLGGAAGTLGHWSALYFGGCWYQDTIGHLNGMWNPTHWRPLPKGPAHE